MVDGETLLPRLPKRPRAAHKGDAGRVVIIGGSLGLSGAPRLAGRAASLAGAGLVTLFVPEPIRAEVASSDPALMVFGHRATASGGLSYAALRDVLSGVAPARAVVLGPGLSRSESSLALARSLIHLLPCPAVIDADALTSLAIPGAWSGSVAPRILTPHQGEAERLLGSSLGSTESARRAAVAALCARFPLAVVVLKGPGTLISDGSRTFENQTGNPGLAKGGSGDILAGLIGGLLAQGLSPLSAARTGVHLHGLAADLMRERCGERALSQDDLLLGIQDAIHSFEGDSKTG